MDMKSTRTLSKMIKVEAWAKHLLEQIENLIKLKKRARTLKHYTELIWKVEVEQNLRMIYMKRGRPRNFPW